MAKKVRFPFVTVEVTPLKAEKEYEHNNLSTWKRQTRRNKISLAAKSDAYSQMLQELFFFSFLILFFFFWINLFAFFCNSLQSQVFC